MVDISYQKISYPLLHDYLESSVITDLIAKHGWQVKSEKGVGQGEGAEQEEEHKVVLIKNQEATIRPKKILAKIEFDSKLIKGRPSFYELQVSTYNFAKYCDSLITALLRIYCLKHRLNCDIHCVNPKL